jgi:chromosomal replication initiator protein
MAENDSTSRQYILHFPTRPEYRFSNFIVSNGSRFAYACARDICSGDPVPYSSLYLSGASGLGKTHLLMSIGNHLAETDSKAKALYVHCRDLIESLDRGDSGLPGNLGTSGSEIDFLLLDDIDQITAHPTAQETLYRIYNQTLEQGGKMVFAGRTPADQLEKTESFLTSRFKWGMTAGLSPMDDEATSKLIQKLAEDLSLDIPDKIITWLLNRIPRDFQSVKSAVSRINEESLRQKHKVTLPLVKNALGI